VFCLVTLHRNDFTLDMFSVQVIEVLGTPLVTDTYIQEFVTHNCIKIDVYIPRNVEKLEPVFCPLTAGKICLNTCTRTLTWKPLTFLSHIKSRTNDDRFPLSLWETWFCSTPGVPIPALIGPSQQCACNVFHYDSYGDHLQTCQTQSEDSQVHDWVVYR